MKFLLSTVACLALIGTSSVAKADLNDAEKAEINKMIESYISNNPKVVLDTLENYRLEQINKVEQEAGEKAAALISDIRQKTKAYPFAGNAKGDIIVTEFFDYNCGYCHKAFESIQGIVENDKDVKVVFVEMPILGPTSLLASQWSLAAEKQGKYFEFHTGVMNHKGQKTAEELTKIAEKVGLDVEKLKKDAASESVQQKIQENIQLAETLGITGTPGFIVETEVIRGYLPYDQMKSVISAERQKKES